MQKKDKKLITVGALAALLLLASYTYRRSEFAKVPLAKLARVANSSFEAQASAQAQAQASAQSQIPAHSQAQASAQAGKPNTQIDSLADEAFYVPRYAGKLAVELNNNEPIFADLVPNFQAYYVFSDLDALGRVGSAEAVLGHETLPKSKRKSISEVIPSGWQQSFYSFIEQQALYTRAHLIAHQLCGENANQENLMTGTSMFNTQGMLPYENLVKDYIKRTHNHVQYRVTPIFGYFDYNEDNLVADGVQMEAKSIEDNGTGVKFNVFIYNVQTGVEIDYLTGENKLNEEGKAMGFKIERKRAKHGKRRGHVMRGKAKQRASKGKVR